MAEATWSQDRHRVYHAIRKSLCTFHCRPLISETTRAGRLCGLARNPESASILNTIKFETQLFD